MAIPFLMKDVYNYTSNLANQIEEFFQKQEKNMK